MTASDATIAETLSRVRTVQQQILRCELLLRAAQQLLERVADGLPEDERDHARALAHNIASELAPKK